MSNLLSTRTPSILHACLRLAVFAVAALGASFPAAAQPGQQKLYAYSSVGDNQWVSDWPPIDSAATVNALFEWYAKTYNVRRMYWRGEQDRMWLRYYSFRHEIPLYYEFWTDWARYLTDKVKVDDVAVAAAHRQGMQIYIFDGLFEHATQGDAGGCGMFPYQCEDKLRQEHPEWCPVDRWGERVCPGPIEFCYPEARKALVARYLGHVTKYGYDGIGFYTYVENYGLRYLDEYGFNEPIVKEFKRRYGVDIRTEPFDKEAWGRLRGEYLTQFLRELHTALTKRGKKLCFTLRGDKPNLPQRWLGLTTDFPGAGRVHHDWETWVKEGLVDELMVWFGSAPEDKQKLARKIQEVAGGKPIEVTIADSSPFAEQWKPFVEAGTALVTVTAPGYGADRYSLESTSMETLNSPDWKLRAQTLVDIAAGKLKTDSATVAPFVSDPHVLVRREAIRALAALTASEQVPLIEAALTDEESSVRIAAANALTKVNGPESARRIVSALSKDRRFQMKEACLGALVAMKGKAQPALVEGMSDPRQAIREVCVRAMGRNGLPESKAPLLAALKKDKDYRVRFYAINGLIDYRTPETAETLLTALSDPDPTVHLRAATVLGYCTSLVPGEQGQRILSALLAFFRQYGDGCKRPDAAWGWRVVGNAVMNFGDAGKSALEQMRTQKQDRWLAWAAYQVVHVPQSADAVTVCEEKDAIETHAKYAPLFPGHRKG